MRGKNRTRLCVVQAFDLLLGACARSGLAAGCRLLGAASQMIWLRGIARAADAGETAGNFAGQTAWPVCLAPGYGRRAPSSRNNANGPCSITEPFGSRAPS